MANKSYVQKFIQEKQSITLCDSLKISIFELERMKYNEAMRYFLAEQSQSAFSAIDEQMQVNKMKQQK
ncbi:unnamed protein product [marine sediment metagenome]|uniref:Uncharacterized protein n=1 Tax=marine sediment metagenome TaxID=412755 RepID=X0SQC3_9ZZZZ